MHKGKWSETDVTELTYSCLWGYQSEDNYTIAMLAEDLLEAGFSIKSISYEEEADIGLKYFVGSYDSVDEFLNDYSLLRSRGMGGMYYHIFCEYKGISCGFGMADDAFGRSYNRITFSGKATEQYISLAGQLKSLLLK